jgi:hypothetical protein
MTRKTRWAISATAAIILVAAIATVLASSTSTPRHITAGHPTTAKACDAGQPDSTIPTAPPPDLAWKNIGPVLVPVSAMYGPIRYRQDLWTCYRHDPMGAVLAAYDIVAASITSEWLQVAEDQFAPGQGLQAYIAATRQQTLQPPQPDQVAQPVGFQVVSYTPQQATIETLADAGNDQYQVDQRTLAWDNGDWKLVLTPEGNIGPDPQLVSSASGFVLWGGTNG